MSGRREGSEWEGGGKGGSGRKLCLGREKGSFEPGYVTTAGEEALNQGM